MKTTDANYPSPQPKWREFTYTDEIIQEGDECSVKGIIWIKCDRLVGRRASEVAPLWRLRTKRPSFDAKKWVEAYYANVQEAIGTNCTPQPIKDIPAINFYQIAKDLKESALAIISLYQQGVTPPQMLLGLFHEACRANDKAVEKLLAHDSDSLSLPQEPHA